jgi:hypothetical protein
VSTTPHELLEQATDGFVRELDTLIDRRFAARRTLTVERESEKHWVAELSGQVLYRSPSRDSVVRFAETFAERTPGVDVVVTEWNVSGDGSQDDPLRARLGERFSVRVPALRVVQ